MRTQKHVENKYAHVRVYYRVVCAKCGEQIDGSQARQRLDQWVNSIVRQGWRAGEHGYTCRRCSGEI